MQNQNETGQKFKASMIVFLMLTTLCLRAHAQTPGAPGSDWYNIFRATFLSPAAPMGPSDFSQTYFSDDPNRNFSVTVRAPLLTNQILVDLTPYLSSTDGILNFNLINCVLLKHSQSPKDYLIQPCTSSSIPQAALGYLNSLQIDPKKPLSLLLSSGFSTAANPATIPVVIPSGSAARAHVLISDQSDLTLSGGGALLNFEDGTNQGIYIRQTIGFATERVQIQSLQIYHGPPAGYPGQIVSYTVNGSSAAVKAIQLSQPLDPRWITMIGGVPTVALKLIASANFSPGLQTSEFTSAGGKGSTAAPTDLLNIDSSDPMHPILYFANPKSHSATNLQQFLTVGASVVAFGWRGGNAVIAGGSAVNDLSFKNVTVFNSPNDAFVFAFTGRGIWLDGCQVTFQSTSQVATAPGAAIRTTGTYGDLVITNGLFEGNGDDVIALASQFYPVPAGTMSYSSATQMLSVNGAANNFSASEKIVLYDISADQIVPLGLFTVTSSPKVLQAQLTYGSIAALPPNHNYSLFSLDRNGSRSFINSNIIRNSGGDGVNAVMTNGIVSQNTFQYLSSRGVRLIMLGYGSTGVMRGGGPSYNNDISDNTFDNVAVGFGQSGRGSYFQMGAVTLEAYAFGRVTQTNFPQFSDISIVNNTMKNIGWFGIYANLGEKISISGNTLDACRSKYLDASCVNTIRTDGSNDLSSNLGSTNTFLNLNAAGITEN